MKTGTGKGEFYNQTLTGQVHFPRMLKSLSLRRVIARSAILVSVAMLVASCALEGAYYPQKGDKKPHAGVASAQSYPIHGIDISRWQANIDWRAVKGAGTRFVYIKATEGGDHIDPSFQQNWAGAKAAGVPRGAYHFVYWCRPAHEQAQWFVTHFPNEPDALPPVLDLEWNGHSRTCPRKVPKELALEKIRLMLGELERHTGKVPVIYTDITFHKDVLESEREFDRYGFWLRSTAALPEQRYHNRRWAFWQYTTTGTVPGIRGDVDRNAFAGTEREFQGWLDGQFDIGLRQWIDKVRGRAPAPRPVESQPLQTAPPLSDAILPPTLQPTGAAKPVPVEEQGTPDELISEPASPATAPTTRPQGLGDPGVTSSLVPSGSRLLR
jgi:lysozyme